MSKPIGVKLLNKYIKSELTQDPILKNIYVIGEVTNLHRNKYTYFDLKEDDELLSCVYFNNDLIFENGDNLIINGSINVYTKASRYQLNVKNLDILGEGLAYLKLRQLKDKLEKKGYFDSKIKKNIPLFPVKIGLITSDKSAAIIDFLSIIEQNYPIANISLYSSKVQGQEAINSIVRGINQLDIKNLDLIVLTRGGGSNEDLSIFNDEKIADAIFKANTPIISAVGHEIDTTISDLVSDLRVSTPTKAAEYIISNFIKSKVLIDTLNDEIYKQMVLLLDKNSYLLDIIKLEVEKFAPTSIIDRQSQLISDISKNDYDIISKKLYANNQIINSIKAEIEDDINKILHENMMKLMDLSHNLVDVNNLKINEEYIMKNDIVSYRIKILEKFND